MKTCCCLSFLISFTTEPILQEPVKLAPGSIDNLLVLISLSIFAVDFSCKSSLTINLAFIIPEMSAFLQVTLPSIIPLVPTTTFPSETNVPITVPSILMSPKQVMSPLILVPFLIIVFPFLSI